ncbi:uncharacterized protein LOC134269182 [Saccostrea cucullata]|uniref:uncharacterized protein LOC134269182 n=1 Tax=Saccostrea cuccullata TaxID=36930 RepID=UPI002ED57FDE
MGMGRFSFLQAIVVFVFVAHSTHIYVASQFSTGIKVLHYGPYQIGDTYRGLCDVELPPDDNITNVDAYWKFGNTDYCHNGQKVLLNRNYTCNATTVQNTTAFELRIPVLTLHDAGTYFCKVKHNTKGATTTFSDNVTVIDPSITTPESTTVTTLSGRDDTGGAASVETKFLSTVFIMLSASLVYI